MSAIIGDSSVSNRLLQIDTPLGDFYLFPEFCLYLENPPSFGSQVPHEDPP